MADKRDNAKESPLLTERRGFMTHIVNYLLKSCFEGVSMYLFDHDIFMENTGDSDFERVVAWV